MTDTRILALLSLNTRLSRAGVLSAVGELKAVGVFLTEEDIIRALRSSNAFLNGLTLEWTVPGGIQPLFSYADLQDEVMDTTGLRGSELHRAWDKIKGHLRLRWAKGNQTRPRRATVVRWATT